MLKFLLITICAFSAACSDDAPSGRPYRAPADFVPADMREDANALPDPLARACVAHAFILRERVAECAGDTFGMSAASMDATVSDCADAFAAGGLPGEYVSTLENCLDHFANAACGALVGDGAGQCYLAAAW
jgi:hypothetical protein